MGYLTTSWITECQAISPIVSSHSIDDCSEIRLLLDLQCTSQMIKLGHFRAGKLTFSNGITRNAPPPAASVIMATYLGFTLQNVESQEDFVILILSYPWSLFNACPKTCRNLLCLTTRNDIWKINIKKLIFIQTTMLKYHFISRKYIANVPTLVGLGNEAYFITETGEIPHWITRRQKLQKDGDVDGNIQYACVLEQLVSSGKFITCFLYKPPISYWSRIDQTMPKKIPVANDFVPNACHILEKITVNFFQTQVVERTFYPILKCSFYSLGLKKNHSK